MGIHDSQMKGGMGIHADVRALGQVESESRLLRGGGGVAEDLRKWWQIKKD